jgi:hypothetical protein
MRHCERKRSNPARFQTLDCFVAGAPRKDGVDIALLLHYNISSMESHPHHHHHPGRAHPPATVSPSILRLSAVERLAAVAVLNAALWGAVLWALAS